MARAAVVVAISALGVSAGVFSLGVARDEPSYWFAGTSIAAGFALLAAGWALVASGLAFWARRPSSRFGPLLTAAGFAWFLLEWNNPGVGSALAFTIGLALYVACPPLVGHAVLAYASGRLRTRVEAGAIVAGYVSWVLVLGVLPAFFYDPEAEGCAQCPRNLLLLSDRPGVAEDLTRAGVCLGLGCALVLGVLAGWRLARDSGAARRGSWPVLAGGIAYFALVGAWFAASRDAGLLSSGTLERRLWLGQAVALAAVAVGVAWNWIRARRARSEVARLVVELAKSPPAGGLRDSLARIVRDPELVLAYPVGDPERLVDSHGRRARLTAGQERTSLVRERQPVAVLGHAPGVLDDEQLVDEVTAAARLALDNERLQAEIRARLEELRASRARIVEAGDAERRRLERDLHDGAQQRLVALSLSLQLLRSRLLPSDVLDEAAMELRAATAELRELAHGIFPAVLADEGLAAAVEALAEDAQVPIEIRALPDDRFAAPVETAAYTLVAEAARAAPAGIVVNAERFGGALVVEVETMDGGALDRTVLEDRVGALDGRLGVEPRDGGRVAIRAELPCGS